MRAWGGNLIASADGGRFTLPPPRIAGISDARLWRTNTAADYGPFQPASNHTIRLDRMRVHWGDMLRLAGCGGCGTRATTTGPTTVRTNSRGPVESEGAGLATPGRGDL